MTATPAQEIAAAAQRLRVLAEAATPGPWQRRWVGQDHQAHSPGQRYPESVAEWTYAIATWEPEVTVQRAECETGDAAYIAAMDPLVGDAVAHILDQAAEALTGTDVPDDEPVLALARLINQQQENPIDDRQSGDEENGQGPAQAPTPPCPACAHPMGDHSVHTAPRPTWCHACNTHCGHNPA